MNAKPSFQGPQSRAKVLALLYLLWGMRKASNHSSLSGRRVSGNPVPVFDGDGDLFGLDDAMGLDGSEEVLGYFPISDERPEPRVTRTRGMAVVDRTASGERLNGVERATVDHSDTDVEFEGWIMASLPRCVLGYLDAALSVEESSEVLDGAHFVSQGEVANLAKSGEPQTGQSRAKQGAETLPGVCREQMLDPKGKVCSELPGNRKSEAETTSPCIIITVLHCNRTDYHRSNLSAVQIIMKPNATGTLSFPTLQYMGVDWNWSRNIAAGRAYMLRPDSDLAFWVHSEGNFKLSPFQRSFNQDLYGASLLLMCAFFARRRMFSMVIDGITA